MFKLKRNPFQNQFTYDFNDYKNQPFIVDGTPLVLKRKLEWDVESGMENRILIKIISAKGAGKSTLSFFLQDTLEQLNKENVLVYYHNNFNKDYFTMLKEIMYKFDIEEGLKSNEEAIRSFLEDKRLFIFMDFQDELTTANFRLLANILQTLPLLSKNISIILTMNKNHDLKMNNYSLVLGKYTTFPLPAFSFENTKNLVEERLKSAREEGYDGNDLYPLEDIIELIHSFSGGMPRNILSACDLILSNFYGQEHIDEDEAALIIQNEFSKKVIFDNTVEGFEREFLCQLYDIIRTKFHGEITKEKDLTDYMVKNYNWSHKTTSKRVRILSKFNLLGITKGADLWSNIIKLN